MNVNDQALKAAYRRYLQGFWPKTRCGCPLTADLIGFFNDDSPRRVKNRILDHVASCGACAEEFAILINLDRRARAFSAEAAGLRTGGFPRERKGMRRGFFGTVRWALAGAGLAAAALVLCLRPPGSFVPPNDPGPLRAGKSIDMIPEAPRGRVDAALSLVFRWRIEGNDAAEAPCVVILYDDSLWEIWRSRSVTSTNCPLPEDIRKSLVPERAYFWGVSSAPGKGISESGLATFSIKRRPYS